VYHHPLGLSNPTLCASQKNVVLISAVSRPQRNEGEVYHTLPGLSNSHPPPSSVASERWIMFRFSARRRLPVRDATRQEFTTPLRGCQIHAIVLLRPYGISLCQVLARPWRNEGGIYHTPQGLSNPCHRTLTILRHLALSGARPFTAQRGATIPSFHDPVKSGRGCSWMPCVLNDIERKGVPGFRPGAQMGNDSGLVYTSAWHVNSAERSSFTWAMWRILIVIRGRRAAEPSGFRRQTCRPCAYRYTERPPTPAIE
jgi:hypothetical protein